MSTAWIEFALRGAGLLTVALSLCMLLRRATPALRHALLAATAMGLLVLPAFSVLLPVWEAPLLPKVQETGARSLEPAPAPAPEAPSSQPRGVGFEASERSGPSAPPAASTDSLQTTPTPMVTARAALTEATRTKAPRLGSTPWLVLLWISGALLVLLPWVAGHWRVARWRLRGTVLPSASELLPDGQGVATHPDVTSPMTVGLLHPHILLPPEARVWSPSRLRGCEGMGRGPEAERGAASQGARRRRCRSIAADEQRRIAVPQPAEAPDSIPSQPLRTVLLHERAHAVRRDVLTAGLARCATALHWFNPLVWIAASRMRRESELACDMSVIQSGIEPETFARTLLALARGSHRERGHDAAATLGRSGLERRVDAILAGPQRRRTPLCIFAMAALAVAFVVMATLQPMPLTASADEEKAPEVITVGPVDADFTTIQAAVDSAPANGHIRIAEGTYEGHIVIGKPLTLEGAGWAKTRLAAAFHASTKPGVRPKPTLRIAHTQDVTLRHLGLTLHGEGREGGVMVGAALDIDGAGVRMLECAVVHSPASGIDISGDADVEIRGCLVSSARSTGIAIGGHGAGMPRVRVLESDIRYGHHRGITVGTGCNEVRIEGCWISGSAWHGLRYDNASPTVLRNRFFHNVRSAIYASGRTRARVEGNCFSDTGMGAVSCWFQCSDTYRGNTFAHNARDGLGILGASNPTIEGNVFFDNPVAIRWSSIGGSGPDAQSAGKGTVRGNVFWKNGQDTSNPVPASHGNRNEDPAFGEHYVMAKDSAVRKAGIGALDLPAPRSPFPVQPEEAAAARLLEQHMDRYGDWNRGKAAPGKAAAAKAAAKKPAASTPSARARSQAWIKDISSSKGGARRKAALDAVREALSSTDPILNHAALMAILGTLRIRYERDGLRELVLPLLERLEGRARVSAWYVLCNLGPETGDLERLLEAVRQGDGALKESASHLILMYTKGHIEGQAEAVVLALLLDEHKGRRREVLRGLWGARVGPRLEARLIELADTEDRSRQYDVVYFALSTLKPKSKAVVQALDKAVEANPSLLGRAAWGLSHGIAEEAGEAVADFYAARIAEVTTASWMPGALRALGRYGVERHAVVLDSIASDEGRSEEDRARARKVADQIRRR